MMDQEQYRKAMLELIQWGEESLKKHEAIEMQAEHSFIGWIRQEPDGRYSNEIWQWGSCKGKMFFGASIEEVRQRAFEVLEWGKE